MLRYLSVVLFIAAGAYAQDSVKIQVDAAKSLGPLKPVWNYFGYDEPNYTTAPNGRKLITELANLSAAPVSFRVHNLLTTGDGTAALKWGSTNAYTETADGKPVYDWSISDAILDTFVSAGARPFVEIGFMPQALSLHPEPYQHHFPVDPNVFTGWSYPPKDYAKWGELVFQWARHCAEKYGKAQAESWEWEVWNEPDIPYWHGTPEEYDKLYDVTVRALRKALPKAKVGGPASTGPANVKAAAFLRQFLEHCATTGVPLDFISFHAKGSPKLENGVVRMGLAKHMRDVSAGFEIVRSFPKFKDLPIVLSESDPEGCAACSSPQNAYRNGTLYAVYMAESLAQIRQLAAQTGVNLEGILTWAFEFENQPYFAGLRSLATNGIDQPVLNVFRMAGMLRGNSIGVSNGNAVATRSGREVSVMLWNYQDLDRTDSSEAINLSVSGLPVEAHRLLLRHYRIDGAHSNSYTVWKQLGSPQQPTPEQLATLENTGALQLLESPRYLDTNQGTAKVDFTLPLQGVSLVQLSW
jgi:xylan 1,4-beta-xylosidase